MQFDKEADGSYKFFEQCPNGNNIWKVKLYHPSSGTSELVGLMLLYVDDIFMMAHTTTIQSALTAIQEHWKMTITVIIQRDDTVPEKPVSEINILGCRVTLGTNDTINLDQIGYIREKLHERGYEGAHGKTSLPEVIQARLVPVPKEERQTAEFLEYRKSAKRNVEC